MSLILDALKKSEEKRQLGQAPTLGSSILATRRRRNLLPYIVAAIVLVALIGLWQFNKYKHSHRSKAPVVAGAPAAPAPVATSPARNNRAPAANPAGVAAAAPATAPAPIAPPPVASATAPSSMVFGGEKPSAAATAPAVAPKTAAPVAGPIAAPAAAVATAPATTPAVVPPATKAIAPPPAFGAAPAPNPASQTAAPTTASTPPAAPIASVPAKAAVSDKIRAPAPAIAANPDEKPVQAYYELPFPVRKDLPAIKISMHVYAVDPAQRFIVVNNVHQGEGDSIEGGVTVREIRPTDIVLEFQGKIFSVPRTGI